MRCFILSCMLFCDQSYGNQLINANNEDMEINKTETRHKIKTQNIKIEMRRKPCQRALM